MTELSRQFEDINPQKELSSQQTLVTIDRSNVRRWKSGVYRNEQAVDEVRLVGSLIGAPTVKTVKIYGSKPSFEYVSMKLETWLAEFCREELVNLKRQGLPPLEHTKALVKAVLDQEKNMEISRKMRKKVASVMAQLEDHYRLEALQEMGAELILKVPKMFYNSMVTDDEFGSIVSGLADMIDSAQSQISVREKATQGEIRSIIDGVIVEMQSFGGISELLVEDSVWADTFALLEKRMLEISGKLDEVRHKMADLEQILGAANMVMEQIKKVMIGDQFLVNKCNLDVEIAVGTLESGVLARYDNFVFLSGDGDFAELYRKLIKEGKKVVVISTPAKLGKEITLLQKEGAVKILNPAEDSNIWKPKLNS